MKPPVPPAKIPDGYDMEPLMRSLFSCSMFSAIADVDHDAPAPGQPSVKLFEWWLATVEGDDQKIAVDGLFKRNQTLYQLCPRPIAKRRSPNILESEDGTTLLLSGSLNISRMLGNGYSITVCEHFMVGFPDWWQSCNLRYPKRTNSGRGCQPYSSNTSNYGVEHFDSDRPPFISKHHDGFKSSSHNDSVFPKSSHLSKGTPRFEERTCDGNIATNENAAASSGDIPTNEDAAASSDGNERYTAASKEANNMEIGLIASSPSNERGHDHIATDVSLDSTVQCTDNTVSEALYSTPATDRKKTPVTCLKNQDSLGGNQHIASNKKPVGRPRKQIFQHEKHQSATISYWTRSTVSREKHASTGGWSHTLSPTCSATPGLLAGSPSNERGHDDIATDVSLAPTVQCTNNAINEALYSTQATGRKKTPVACLKNQGSLGGNQHIASNKKPVGRPNKPHEKHQSATISYWTRSSVSREKHASTGGWSHTLSPTCSAAPGLLAGSPSNERGHDDIATDVSLAPTAQCTNNAINEAVYSTPATDCKTTPVACLKNQGSLRGNQHIASNKKPVGRPKKPHEKHQSATRSHGTRSAVSQVSKATSLSIPTPEDLKLKRTRSGRVIVPQLDEGCQSIVYASDRSIKGVIGLDSPAMPKWIESKTNQRKNRRTNRRKKRRTE